MVYPVMTAIVNNSENKTKNILFVGRLDYQKGIDLFHLALKFIMTNNPEFEADIFIIGDSVSNSKPIEKIKSSKNVSIEYLGWQARDKIQHYYSYADYIIMPSRWEGFAMVTLEAMSHGVIPICSAIPPFQEIIIDGEDGFLFKSEDPIDLAEKILNLDKIDKELLSVSARTKIAERFSDIRMNNEVIDIYKSLKR